MLLVAVLIVVVPLSAAIGWFIIAPLLAGDPPLTSPDLSAKVSMWCPTLRRRWPPYSRHEKAEVDHVRRSRLGRFA